MSDWSTRGSDGRFIWSLETTPIPRIHQFDLRTERWVRQGLLPPNLPPGPIRGFSWNPTLVGWTVLIGTPGAYHLVGLSESGDEVIESLRLLAGASNLAGLVVSDAGVVYTVRIHGGLPQLATINPTEGTLTPLLDLDIAVSDKATLAIDPASGDLYIAIPFSEGAFAPIPSQLARYDVASSEAENLGVLGSSFLNFSGFTFIPAERGAASEGWFLH
jgi:hypothetical protein